MIVFLDPFLAVAHTHSNLIQKIIRFRIAILLALTSWVVYGSMINVSDVKSYGLYQVGAESLVEYNTYSLGHSIVPGWKDAGDGDVFDYKNHKFPAKQPGSFFATAIVYSFFHSVFGMSFLKNQELVSSLDTWFTASLIGSIAIGIFYEILLLMGFSIRVAVISSLTFAFATLFFPYTGVPHHDILATSCLIFGFFCILRGRQTDFHKDFRAAGAWLSFTLFFSMLPAILVGLLSWYGFAVGRKVKNRIHFVLGFILGYLPLGLINAHYFGNPFTQANVAGNYQDTFFKFSFSSMEIHFHDYFGLTSYLSVIQIMPVFVVGMLGILVIQKKLRQERILLTGMLIAHLGYLFNISTIGHCQYGPRYLIPLIPFMMIGFATILEIKIKTVSPILKSICAIVALYSFAINSLGAIGDTMYCGNLVESPILKYYHDLPILLSDHFWMRPYCSVVLLIEVLFLFWLNNHLPANRSLSKLT